MAASLNIIIVNWNSGDQLRACLCSLAESKKEYFYSYQVIVVDNASSDNSCEGLESIDLPLNLVRNKNNIGFGAACNQGAKIGESDYLLFLNPDVFLSKNSLSVALAFLERYENSGVGICGIQLLEESGRVARSCARFPSIRMFAAQAVGLNKLPWFRSWNTHMSEWDHTTTRKVDHVIGAFYLMRRSLFESLGGFDERFFVYLEDLDFSLRSRQAGWQTVYLAEAQAFHIGGGASCQIIAMRLFYSLRSRLLYGFKHFSKLNAWLLLLITITLEPCSRLVLALSRLSFIEASNILRAYKMLLKSIPRIVDLNKNI